MSTPRPHRVWLRRFAVAAWLGLGALVAWLAPSADPLSPSMAERFFGDTRTVQSSAPGGLWAFAAWLGRLGFVVTHHTHADAPDAELLVSLAPKVRWEPAEIDTLVAWVQRGGRFVYASATADEPTEPELDVEAFGDQTGDEPESDETAATETETEVETDAVPDPVWAALAAAATTPAENLDDRVTALRLGRGQAVLLADRGAALTNQALQQGGLAATLVWLRPLLADVTTVAFDEGRLATGESDGMIALLGRSRFAAASALALIALLVWLVAASVRRIPAQPEPPPGGRDFGEHLDALAGLFWQGHRHALARRAMLAGTRRRLGGLANTKAARAVLDPAEAALAHAPSPTEVAALAERLRALEAELLADPAKPTPT